MISEAKTKEKLSDGAEIQKRGNENDMTVTTGIDPIPGPVKERPGITYERIQNLFDPYVAGIAVRP